MNELLYFVLGLLCYNLLTYFTGNTKEIISENIRKFKELNYLKYDFETKDSIDIGTGLNMLNVIEIVSYVLKSRAVRDFGPITKVAVDPGKYKVRMSVRIKFIKE